MPHAVCWAAEPRLIWTMVVTNAITFLSYLSICITLLYLVRRTRRVIARDWAWFCVGFALFIVACGSTHLMEVVTTWYPAFWTAAAANIITAILSAVVALMLIRRAAIIGFSINDYADRLSNTEAEKVKLRESLLASRKLEDWSRMSAAVAHEINQPLETIQNILYLIRTSEGASPEIVELAQCAADEADRVVTISRSTLTFFRQSSHPEPVDMRVAADSVGFILSNVFQKKDIHFEVHREGELTVEAFPGETRQVMLNLVRNAADATMARGTTIRLSLVGFADRVEMIVRDQGSGIPGESLAKLFEFGATTKGEQGNGMGLWTVKHIVNKHGGEISVDSVPGHGTTFTIIWPRRFSASAGANVAKSQMFAERL